MKNRNAQSLSSPSSSSLESPAFQRHTFRATSLTRDRTPFTVEYFIDTPQLDNQRANRLCEAARKASRFLWSVTAAHYDAAQIQAGDEVFSRDMAAGVDYICRQVARNAGVQPARSGGTVVGISAAER